MGRQFLEYELRVGRLHTLMTDENVVAERKLITEDPRITYREMEATLEIGSFFSINSHLTTVPLENQRTVTTELNTTH